MMFDFLKTIQNRRSIYHLGNKWIIPKKELINIIEQCLKHAPTAFNSQGARLVVLLDAQNKYFWDLVAKKLQLIVAEDNFANVKAKTDSFADGLGTILFFEDNDTIAHLQKKYPAYKNDFDFYSWQSSGMLQYMIWTALASNNLGASLQHYSNLIENDVKDKWNLPKSWKLISQMPFGNIETLAQEKTFLSLKNRLIIKDGN